MTDEKKIQAFEQMILIAHGVLFDAMKKFLVEYNPNEETIDALKEVVENGTLMMDTDMCTFLDKWREYVEMRKKSVEKMYKDSVDAQFLAMMQKEFNK